MTNATVDQIVGTQVARIDLSLTITGIIAICAVFSPGIVALINNHHQRKMRLLEMKHEEYMRRTETIYLRVMDVFESYIGALEACAKNRTFENKTIYGAALGRALAYASDSTQEAMMNIDHWIMSSSDNDVPEILSKKEIAELCALLRQDLIQHIPEK